MILLGSIVNAIAIIIGGTIGILLKGGLPKKTADLIITGLSFIIVCLGVGFMLKSEALLIVIFSVGLGCLLGDWINIEKRLEDFAESVQKKLKGLGGNFSAGFVTTSLLYCVGSMAILGSFQSGLEGKHDILFAKSLMDGIISVVFASTLGFGVIFSAIPVFLYQGGMTLLAGVVAPYAGVDVVREMTATGGILLICIGVNVSEIKKIKVGNMLPAIFLPVILMPIGVVLNTIGTQLMTLFK